MKIERSDISSDQWRFNDMTPTNSDSEKTRTTIGGGDYVDEYYGKCIHFVDTICGPCMIQMLESYAEERVQACLAECMKIDDKTAKNCYSEGFRAGQEAMRGRAASVCDGGFDSLGDSYLTCAADKIRSLSIGEKQ